MSGEEQPSIQKGWADDDEELQLQDLYDQPSAPEAEATKVEKPKQAAPPRPVSNTHFVQDDIMYEIRMKQWHARQARIEEKRKNKKPSLFEMVLIIIIRNLMCFFLFMSVFAAIYMVVTLEDSKPNDFNLELSDNYQLAQDYVNKNKAYYLPGVIGDSKNNKTTSGDGEGTFLKMVKSASKTMNDEFRNYNKQKINPGFVMINPLYVELQKASPISKEDYEIASITSTPTNSMSVQKFYRNHLTKSLPLIFRKGCSSWPLTIDISKLQSSEVDNYFESVMNEAVFIHLLNRPNFSQYNIKKFSQGYGLEKVEKYIDYSLFTKSKRFSDEKYLTFLEDQDISNEPIIGHIGEQAHFPIDTIEQYEKVLLTQWVNFVRIPKWSNKEQMVCVVEGKEKFKIVSPIYRQNIYVGAFEIVPPHQSPLNFFDVDYDKYKMAKNVKFIDFTLETGDCAYIPAFFYAQSQSINQYAQSSLITHVYKAHSEFVDMFMDGIEGHGWVDEQENGYDTQLMKFMSQFY